MYPVAIIVGASQPAKQTSPLSRRLLSVESSFSLVVQASKNYLQLSRRGPNGVHASRQAFLRCDWCRKRLPIFHRGGEAQPRAYRIQVKKEPRNIPATSRNVSRRERKNPVKGKKKCAEGIRPPAQIQYG